MNGTKKLYRIEQGATLTGVCGGIAEYLNIDANLVRIVWAVITLFPFGAGLIIYILASLLLPKKSEVYPGY